MARTSSESPRHRASTVFPYSAPMDNSWCGHRAGPIPKAAGSICSSRAGSKRELAAGQPAIHDRLVCHVFGAESAFESRLFIGHHKKVGERPEQQREKNDR